MTFKRKQQRVLHFKDVKSKTEKLHERNNFKPKKKQAKRQQSPRIHKEFRLKD